MEWGKPQEKGECVEIIQRQMMHLSMWKERVPGRWVSMSEGDSVFQSHQVDGLAGFRILVWKLFFPSEH